jgi:ribosomal protein L29
MFNPLTDNFSELSDNELESKILELSKKYFQSRNPQLQQQVGTILEMLKEESKTRRAKAIAPKDDDENSLDNLINIS